jgi:hypothetical protein
VASIIDGFRRPLSGSYNLWRLVDSRFFDGETAPASDRHIICDIDKTYLETEFATLLQIAKIAFENAQDKITVRGASEVLLAARWGLMDELGRPEQDYPRSLHFVSSSPPQLRSVLEEKFALDGLDWSSDTFKNQAYNIRKGRFDLLKQQIAYKTAAILNLMHQQKENTRYYMLGDNAEADVPIYLGIKLFVEHRLSGEKFREYLQLLGVEAEVARALLERFTLPPRGRVEAILIRRIKKLPAKMRSPLTKPVVFFDNFFEVALVFSLLGLIDARTLWELIRSFHARYGISREKIAGYLRGARRNATEALPLEDIDALLEKLGTAEADSQAVEIHLPHDGGIALLDADEILQYCKKLVESLEL